MNELEETLNSMMRFTGGQFPPPVASILQGEVISYHPHKSMRARFPLQEKFNNPFGITFGGTYSMYFDMVMGPFSGVEAGAPTTSLDLNVSFLKPLKPSDEYVEIDISLISKSRQFILLAGQAYKPDGTLVATASSRMFILGDKKTT